MILCKILVAVGLLVSDTPDELDSDGWYTIPKAKQEERCAGADERDLSVWVVFSKKIGSEKIMVSLPDQPYYHCMGEESDELEVVAQSEAAEFRLQVLNQTAEDPSEILKQRIEQTPEITLVRPDSGQNASHLGHSSDISYWKEGFWYHERVVISNQHTYLLQTKSTDNVIDAHFKFADSLCIEFFPQ